MVFNNSIHLLNFTDNINLLFFPLNNPSTCIHFIKLDNKSSKSLNQTTVQNRLRKQIAKEPPRVGNTVERQGSQSPGEPVRRGAHRPRTNTRTGQTYRGTTAGILVTPDISGAIQRIQTRSGRNAMFRIVVCFIGTSI